MSSIDTLRYRCKGQPWYGPIPVIEAKEAKGLNQGRFDAVLLTAVQVELDAVLRRLEPLPGQQAIWRVRVDQETYYLGRFGSYTVVATMCEKGAIGPNSATLATYDAITNWMPRAVIMIGIAFGKGPELQEISDVLISSEVIAYERQRVGKRLIYRSLPAAPGPTLLNRFRNIIGWRFVKPNGAECSALVGPILSGEKLIDHDNYKRRLLDQFPDAIGGEMEGAGVHAAASRSGVEWIIVKAICDWGDGKKDKKHQPLAAAAAASLVHFVLSTPDALPRRSVVINENPQKNSNLEQPREGRPADLDDWESVRRACYSVTKGTAKLLIDSRPIIPRHGFRAKLNEFLASQTRYCVVFGTSGVGKSVTVAAEALRLFDIGWSSCLMVAGGFSVEQVHKRVCEEMATPSPAATFRQMIRLLTELAAVDSQGLVIFIDAIDDTNPDRIASELRKLHEEIGDLPIGRLKVVISCRDISWADLKNHPGMPLYQQEALLGLPSTSSYVSVEISDFAPPELDSALEEIGAEELLMVGQVDKQDDYHILALRDLLSHPARFGHYANLKASGSPALIENLTWSTLIERSINESITKASRRCGVLAEDLREYLIRFSSHGWQAKSRGFMLDRHAVNDSLPELVTKKPDADLSPYSALLETGLLIEAKTPDGGRTIAFRLSDAGAYFLSIDLERRLTGSTAEEFREIAQEWVREAWNYSPSLDAVLAWIDRLVDTPYDRRLLSLIKVIINGYHNRDWPIFRLVRPAIIASIFEIVKYAGPQDFYAYRDAAREVRYSADSLSVIRAHLKDPDPRVRQLATELVGIHGDVDSEHELLALFSDSDEEVRSEVYGAFRRLGKRVVNTLTEVASDPSKSPELRGHCLGALRAVGYRDDRISASIEQCLSNPGIENPFLLKNAFLLAAHLRDRGHISAATGCLSDKNLEVVHAAAKYLTEVPAGNALGPLEVLLRRRFLLDDKEMVRYWVLRQLLVALVRADSEKAEPIVLELMRSACDGAGNFNPVEVVWAAEKLRSPALYVLVLEQFISQLQETPERSIVFHASETLGAVWREEDLQAVTAAANVLMARGLNLARLFVDAVARGAETSEGYRLADQLSRVSDLNTAVKCQAKNLMSEAETLLNQAKQWSVNELCDLFWVAGDSQVEQALLNRLANPVSQSGRVWYERSNVAKALGTCGTKQSWGAIRELLRTEDSISAYFSEDALFPLAVRKMVSSSDLAAVVRDTGCLSAGRASCLITLALLSVRRHKDLFIEAASYSENELVQKYAVRLLGFTKDQSVSPTLLRVLRTSSHLLVRSEAAEALGRLGVRDAVYDIESALEDSPASGFIKALGQFQNRSSLPLILEGVRTGRGQISEDYHRALGAFWRFPEGRKATEAIIAEWSRARPSLFDEQSAVVVGLLNHQPSALLAEADWLLGNGYLKSGARAELAKRIRRLTKRKDVDKATLIQTVKRLVCDRDVTVRELTLQSLHQVGVRFCRQLHLEIISSPDSQEWDRACAVHLMALGGDDIRRIEAAQYDREFLVRRAADEALDREVKRLELQRLIQHFATAVGLPRLSAYLCLKDQGDLFTIESLNKTLRTGSVNYTFLRSLTTQIRTRTKKEYKERQENEDKLAESRGTVFYD